MAEMKKGAWVAGLLIVAAIVAGVKLLMPAKNEATTTEPSKEGTTTPQPSAAIPPSKEPMATNSAATQKEVMVKTSYQNPAGADDVRFTLVVDAAGTIVDAKTDVLAIHDISMKRQTAFAEGFTAAVKGKKLSELTAIDRVGGSSLTTKAFNESLAELKAGL